jgi:hypothetical protein
MNSRLVAVFPALLVAAALFAGAIILGDLSLSVILAQSVWLKLAVSLAVVFVSVTALVRNRLRKRRGERDLNPM